MNRGGGVNTDFVNMVQGQNLKQPVYATIDGRRYHLTGLERQAGITMDDVRQLSAIQNNAQLRRYVTNAIPSTFVSPSGITVSNTTGLTRLLSKYSPADQAAFAGPNAYTYNPDSNALDALRGMSRGEFLLSQLNDAKIDASAQDKASRLVKGFSTLPPGNRVPSYDMQYSKGYNLQSPQLFGMQSRAPTNLGGVVRGTEAGISQAMAQYGGMSEESDLVAAQVGNKYMGQMLGALNKNEEPSVYRPIPQNVMAREKLIYQQRKRETSMYPQGF